MYGFDFEVTTPILPPWATEANVQDAVKELVFEIALVHTIIDQTVYEGTPTMIGEAEALLTHEAEGW